MLTLFAIPKAFQGHFGLIQRNAILSWTRLQPRPHIVLFGDDQGTAAAARELGVDHVPQVARNAFGTPLLNGVFDYAQQTSPHDLLCYANADILLLDDFQRAVERVAAWRSPVLMVGRRWDLDVVAPIDFGVADWDERLRAAARAANHQRPYNFIDYFVFTRGLFEGMPPLAIGRPGWDNYALWLSRSRGAALVDASAVVTAVHQNHDYSHLPKVAGVRLDEEARLNRALIGEWWHMYTIEDASHRLTAEGFEPSHRHPWLMVKRAWSHPGSFLRLAAKPFRRRTS